MTALAAFVSRSSDRVADACDRMLTAQSALGRRPKVQASIPPGSLGCSIYPLTVQDHLERGPVRGCDNTVVLVLDGRLDNRVELASALGIAHGRLNELSDGALVMAAYEKWDESCFKALRGPFAIILWNSRREHLLLARDPLGQRPLHYHRANKFVAAASMPKGLHALPEVPYKADQKSIADFLALIPEAGENSPFEAIERVKPGHIVTIDADKVTSRSFWAYSEETIRFSCDSEYVEALADHFDRAVRRCLNKSSGNLGCHLSAGLDSAGVTATAARLLAPERVWAFTAVPSCRPDVPMNVLGDEGPLASIVAQDSSNVDHVLVSGEGRSPVDLLDRQFQLFERPVLNPTNAVWSEAVNDAAKAAGVTVLLTGQMGNLTFSHHGLTALSDLISSKRLIAAARLARSIMSNGVSGKSVIAAAIGPWLPEAVWQGITARMGSRPGEARSLLRASAAAKHDCFSRGRARDYVPGGRPWRNGRRMRRWALERVDLGVYIKGTLAGWGIDLRDPTADLDLIDFCFRVPEEQFILGGQPRALARRLLADRLPREFLANDKRGLQAADWHIGMSAARQQMREEAAAWQRCEAAAEIIDLPRFEQALEQWPERDWNTPRVSALHRHGLSRAVAAGHFMRKVARTN